MTDFATFPVAPQTGFSDNVSFNPYVTELVPGQVYSQQQRDFLPSRRVESNVKVFTQDLETAVIFLDERLGYYPFYFNGVAVICRKYTVNYAASDNEGFISMDLIRFQRGQI